MPRPAHFGINGGVSRNTGLHFGGSNPHRPHETGRPASGEQLLRIGAAAFTPKSCKLDVQPAIRAPGRAVAASYNKCSFGVMVML